MDATQIIPIYSTPRQFCEKYEAFPMGGLRKLLFNADSNGLLEKDAVIKVGNKILINDNKFFAWLEWQHEFQALVERHI